VDRLPISSFAAVATNLFFVPAACEVADSNPSPAKLRHYLRQTAESARSPIALRDLEQIQQGLTANAFQTVKILNLAANALQLEPPGIDGLGRGKFCLSHSFHECRHELVLGWPVKTLSQGHSSAHGFGNRRSLIKPGILMRILIRLGMLQHDDPDCADGRFSFSGSSALAETKSRSSILQAFAADSASLVPGALPQKGGARSRYCYGPTEDH
jgi:hypothetical protein